MCVGAPACHVLLRDTAALHAASPKTAAHTPFPTRLCFWTLCLTAVSPADLLILVEKGPAILPVGAQQACFRPSAYRVYYLDK